MSWLDGRFSRLRRWEGYARIGSSRPRHKLDSNENWLVPAAELRELLLSSADSVDPREYPDAEFEKLTGAISKMVGIEPGSVVVCNGADQAIDLLCTAFLGEGDRAVIVSPTFSMYGLRAAIAGAEPVEVPLLPDFRLPVDEVLRRAGREGVVFVCSPNNPTGNQFARDDLVRLLDSFSGLVVLDEAYVEFAGYSMSREVRSRRNLAILRTFSKAYGLAGLRLGYILANDGWAPDFLDNVQYPYPVSALSASLALGVLARPRRVEGWIRAVKAQRELLKRGLRGIEGTTVPDSQANFLMAGLPVSSSKAQKALLAKGVSAKNLGEVLGIPDCLRVTVGTRPMNRALLEGLREVCG